MILLLFRRLLAQAAWVAAGWWHEARFAWYTKNKRPLAFVSVFGLGLAAMGTLIHTAGVAGFERREIACLALNVYFEARGEPLAGQYAVAEVTMNRVASPHYPDTVCEVVYQKNFDPLRGRYVGAFSWTDLEQRPVPQGEQWRLAQTIAEEVYTGRYTPQLAQGVLHYHATNVRPSWSHAKERVARIGRHVFYR